MLVPDAGADQFNQTLKVIRCRFEPVAFDRALGTCSGECTPPDSREEYRGVTFYSCGEDYRMYIHKVLAPPVFDQNGNGSHIAVQERYVLRALGMESMKSMVDASQDGLPSLADVEEYRLLVQRMSGLGAYDMLLTDRTQGFEETLGEAICPNKVGSRCQSDRAQLEEREGKLMLWCYQAFATGVGKDEREGILPLCLSTPMRPPQKRTQCCCPGA